MKRQYYIGHKNGDRHLFYSDSPVTKESHGSLYTAVVGPFITKRGALFMLEHGVNNPHCQSVADAEKLAKEKKSMPTLTEGEQVYLKRLWQYYPYRKAYLVITETTGTREILAPKSKRVITKILKEENVKIFELKRS